MLLYFSPGACSMASRIVAEAARLTLDYTKIDLETHKTADGRDYTEINPKGAVPALRLDDGSLLTENVAILQFLGDLAPDAELVPPCSSMARVRLQEWLGFLASEIHKGFAPLFHGGGDAAQARAALGKQLGFIEAALSGDYLNGSSFSVADAYLFVMLTWTHKTGVDLKPFPKLSAFKARIAALPAVKRAMAAEGFG